MNALLFFVGCCVGSLLNVICYRLLKGEGFVSGRSRCDHCGKQLSFMETMPLSGWLLLRGRCRHCGKPIDIKYPLTEVFSGVVTVIIWSRGDSEAFLYWLFIMTMTLISLFDIETMEISTRLLFFLALVGIMISFTNDASLVSRILGSMTLSLPLLSVNRLREVIGDGDIFIFMITGWAFGCEFLFRSVLISCITGLLYSLITGKRKMPFCPFLTIGIMASLL